MAENGDESAKLWKVNRTIHELVNDRVSTILYLDFIQLALKLVPGFPSFR